MSIVAQNQTNKSVKCVYWDFIEKLPTGTVIIIILKKAQELLKWDEFIIKMMARVVLPLLHGEARHRIIKLSGVGQIMYVAN